MKNYDVSIIVPVYNRAEIIKPCIESINSQTYDKSKWEVIFVDDASTDNSIDTIETLINKNINYRVLKRPVGSGNASAPRNEGIKASLGKYVFFLDSDDYVDHQLLENGMAMALRNDSDIVYVKMKGIGRKHPTRSFKIDIVDNADVLKNHLVRPLNPLKFIKLELLNSNNILFIQSLVKGEDQVFIMHALTKAKIVSILSDKDYYMAVSHEDEHLSRKPISMHSFYQTVYMPLSYIYMMNNAQDYNKKKKLYNGWLLRSVERIRDFSRVIDITNKNFEDMFQLASSYFNIHKEFFDLSQIYENEKLLTLIFLAGDFTEFYRIANESKVLKDLQNTLQKEFSNELGFSRAWIFRNKILVLDFTLRKNKIAFDLEVDDKLDSLKIRFFSRNSSNSLKTLRKNAIKVEGNKFLVFDGKLNNKSDAIKEIKKCLKEVRN